jgi:hypothetical protein
VHKATGDQFWVADPPAELFVVLETNTFLIPKGWHKYKRSDAAGFLALSDVVVVNYGLHYHAPSGQPPEAKYPIYEAAMGAMFDQLAAFASQHNGCRMQMFGVLCRRMALATHNSASAWGPQTGERHCPSLTTRASGSIPTTIRDNLDKI